MKTSFRPLITGARGQLALEFQRRLQRAGKEYLALSRDGLDISDFKKTLAVIRELKPTHIINCASYNSVDVAEIYPLDAYRVNSIGVANLALASHEVNAFLIHYSTDYVFDGKKDYPYIEGDEVNPLNEYGRSKLIGELILQQITDKYLIFRTSWVYGYGTQNFLYKLTKWAQSQEYLKIACDEFSVPTSTRTIAEVTLRAIEEDLTGLYHLVNSGFASRYEWAREYLKLKQIEKFVRPVYQSEFNLPAKRPKWSVMSNERLVKIINLEIPHWSDELIVSFKYFRYHEI